MKNEIHINQVNGNEKVEPIKMPDITEYPFKSFDFDVKFQQWMLDVTNWINSQNKGE